ncbi:hypothetical protein NC797_09115 [Aquibacillus sp. 3ASR75-11]|uniref:DUF6922 domain-containing protein n=1 Tax=Terrihalobacillus insolitus TaxID=2950438 RepID=A0A9X3WU53_9BACI|nr:hypothetical protein [Terrihalobacillus insolitus]MDC3424668.1 hypothetical protein [Terrihalobacillus insolitus]
MLHDKYIPEIFKPFFWDVDIKTIDLEFNRIYVIERLLNHGDHRTLRWLFSIYSLGDIREAVCVGRNFSLKTARYWQHFFHLSEGGCGVLELGDL